MLPMSGVEALLASSGISMPRICPPAPPPMAPAMVLPSVPRSMFLAAPAATLPPMAPLMTWMIRLMSNPDMTRYSPDPMQFQRMQGAGSTPRWHNLEVWACKVTLRKRKNGSKQEKSCALPIAPLAAQRRQSDAGGIETAIDSENLPGDIARAVAAQKEHRFRQLFFEAIAIERNGVMIVGADLRRVHRLRHRGLDRSRCYAVDADAERGQFDGELLCQMRETGLAGAIGRTQRGSAHR